MKISLINNIPDRLDVLAIPCPKNLVGVPNNYKDLIRPRIKSKDFKAEPGESIVLYPEKKKMPTRLLIVGLGDDKKIANLSWRKAGGAITRALSLMPVKNVGSLALNKISKVELESFVEGLAVGDYALKSQAKKGEPRPEELKLIGQVGQESLVKRVVGLMDGVLLTRRLANAPAGDMNPERMEEEVLELAKLPGVEVEIWDDEKLKKEKMNCIRAVGQGSQYAPRLAIIRYRVKDLNKATALVGKGVCFDSGGYNLKPTGSIENMYEDMTGAATVIGVMKALANSRAKMSVVALTPIVENLVSHNAYKPGDLLTARNGKTIEVTNTDAEGRLILCDTLALVSEWKPKRIIDVATLTGAALVAIGDRFSGLFTSDDKLADALLKAGNDVDEPFWRLPLHPDYASWMEGTRSDLRNTSKSRWAGASTAAEFLRNFVDEKISYAHIDLSASMPQFTSPPDIDGCSGSGVRALMQYIKKAG